MRQPHEDNGERSSSASANKSTPSTTWTWKKVRVPSSPAAGQHSTPKAFRWYHHAPWKRREFLTLRVRYRGGSEAWIEIQSRGSSGRFSGSAALLDVLSEIWQVDPNDPQ